MGNIEMMTELFYLLDEERIKSKNNKNIMGQSQKPNKILGQSRAGSKHWKKKILGFEELYGLCLAGYEQIDSTSFGKVRQIINYNKLSHFVYGLLLE